MGKYLILWETDESKVPISPQERGAMWGPMVEIVKENLEKGVTKDWGFFDGEMRGFSIFEGSKVELANELQMYVPFIKFRVHAISSIDDMAGVIKTLNG